MNGYQPFTDPACTEKEKVSAESLVTSSNFTCFRSILGTRPRASVAGSCVLVTGVIWSTRDVRDAPS